MNPSKGSFWRELKWMRLPMLVRSISRGGSDILHSNKIYMSFFRKSLICWIESCRSRIVRFKESIMVDVMRDISSSFINLSRMLLYLDWKAFLSTLIIGPSMLSKHPVYFMLKTQGSKYLSTSSLTFVKEWR